MTSAFVVALLLVSLHPSGAEQPCVVPGAEDTLEYVNEITTYEVSGTVRFATADEPAAGAIIKVCSGRVALRSTTSDQNGRFHIGGMKPGKYELHIGLEGGYHSVILHVVISKRAKRREIAVKLEPA